MSEGWSHQAQDVAQAAEKDGPPEFRQVMRTWPLGRFLLALIVALVAGGVATGIVAALQ